ncbi:hypothetical protein BGZ94_001269 [Podila epigama]|nr:hypothetical protein BGZ94_001269 [Podila epigama]
MKSVSAAWALALLVVWVQLTVALGSTHESNDMIEWSSLQGMDSIPKGLYNKKEEKEEEKKNKKGLLISYANPFLVDPERPKECPPCFNCQLEAFPCSHFAPCNPYDGRCVCPPGFAGDNCSVPVCGALPDGRDRPQRKEDEKCKCKEGWSGINCNVPTGKNGTCYQGGLTVYENFQQCDVTNRKILDTLGPDQPPAITFSCNQQNKTCDFQFWVDEVESFYCHLDECSFGQDIDDFLEEEIRGPADFVCNEKNKCTFEEPAMNDLIMTMFGDPAIYLKCHSGECMHYTQVPGFTRPPRPDYTVAIILSIIGVFVFLFCLVLAVCFLAKKSSLSGRSAGIVLPDDESSKLMADHIPATLLFKQMGYTVGGKEVLRQVSGLVRPGQVMAIMGASGAGKTSLLDILARRQKSGTVSGQIYVNGRIVSSQEYKRVVGYVDQEDTLMPTLTVYETIMYSALLRLPREMSYEAKRYRVLETMSELGILGIKDMRIGTSGQRSISGGEKRRVSIACELVTSPSILFLDEPTSGLDSFNAYNVIECLVSLARNYHRTVVCTIHQPRSNIFALFDQLVLMAKGHLVYSGETKMLNAHLKSLGHTCPEGFNMADYMLDLTMYKGHKPGRIGLEGQRLRQDEEEEEEERRERQRQRQLSGDHSIQEEQEAQLYEPHPAATSSLNLTSGLPSLGSNSLPRFTRAPSMTDDTLQWERELESREHERPLLGAGMMTGAGDTTVIGIDPSPSSLGGRSRRVFGSSSPQEDSEDGEDNGVLNAHLQLLVEGFKQSSIYQGVEQEIAALVENAQNGRSSTPSSGRGQPSQHHNNPPASGTSSESVPPLLNRPELLHSEKAVSSYRRASWWSQFRILADRTLKNIYRDPMLMLSHYVMSIFLGLLCGALFYKVTNDIPGFQNRMGVFFFMCALFGFSCLSILPSFAHERILFVRERANGYYTPWTYFGTKVLFDIVPLRIIPPMLMGLIIYNMVGLVEGWKEFAKFFLVLVLFNLTASGVCLMIGIMFEAVGVANLMSSLVMLFSMLFGGLLLNKDSIPEHLSWLQKLSFFNFAFEALLVNEITFLQLIQKEYGLEIDVPGAVILSTFGFNSGAYWKDVQNLAIMAATFFSLAFLWLQLRVNERR